MRIVTTAPVWSCPSGAMSVTLPTLTPPMRTNESLRTFVASANWALISKWWRNGIALVNPK